MLKDRLKEARTNKGLTQKVVAKAIGISERTVWRLERGDIPHPNVLAKLSVYLGVDVHHYFSVDEWKQFKAKWPGQARILQGKEEKAPLCLCGCGEAVSRVAHSKAGKRRRGDWGRYKRGHWGKWSGVAHDTSAKNRNEYARLYRLANIERELERGKNQYKKLKSIVIEHYTGGKNQCVCCGESMMEFLTVDHIVPQRRRGGSMSCGSGLYARLRSQGFPEGFQILCFNCNCAKRTYETCPHKWAKTGSIAN